MWYLNTCKYCIQQYNINIFFTPSPPSTQTQKILVTPHHILATFVCVYINYYLCAHNPISVSTVLLTLIQASIKPCTLYTYIKIIIHTNLCFSLRPLISTFWTRWVPLIRLSIIWGLLNNVNTQDSIRN